MKLSCGTIDIGNTRAKLRYTFYDRETKTFSAPVFTSVSKENLDVNVLNEWCKLNEIKYLACSASGYVSKEIKAWFEKKDVIVLSNESKMPIKILYSTPATLGRDRIAVAIAANSLYPSEGNLVIDLGTCITYDWVNEKGDFLGGNISPGIEMRLEAMHEKTASLPKAEISYDVDLVGNSTISALQHGAVMGTICEIESFIERSEEKYENLVVLLTGGNATEVSKLLKKNHVVHEDLLHVGLCELIRYNYDEIK